MSKGYENALLIVTKTIDMIMTGEMHLHDLVVSKILGQRLDKYKSLFPHVSAAIQLANEGRSTMGGEDVEYIFTDARHTNPLSRVTPRVFIKEGQRLDYDKDLNTVKCFWKQPKQYWDILVLIGTLTVTLLRRKIGNGVLLNEERIRDRETERI